MTTLGEELLHTVNKLQDLVFNTIGTDSLDLPQIV
jgi:dynamin 1-like protein